MVAARIHIMSASRSGTSTLAAAYDEGDLKMRSLARHRVWLDSLPCPAARFEEEMPAPDLVEGVLREMV